MSKDVSISALEARVARLELIIDELTKPVNKKESKRDLMFDDVLSKINAAKNKGQKVIKIKHLRDKVRNLKSFVGEKEVSDTLKNKILPEIAGKGLISIDGNLILIK